MTHLLATTYKLIQSPEDKARLAALATDDLSATDLAKLEIQLAVSFRQRQLQPVVTPDVTISSIEADGSSVTMTITIAGEEHAYQWDSAHPMVTPYCTSGEDELGIGQSIGKFLSRRAS